METEELIKLVDSIYKNILDKFNPGARQMINAGKAYLKALHGAAAASRLYVDAISKLARQAQQGTWGGCSDIGAALMKVVEVYKEIQEQQMNILKAFYVDLLVPLETNLEKDTKVVQSEQKRFLQQHKQRSETYSKAAALMKKQRKKSKTTTKSGLTMDRELKNMQVLEEEKTKLDAFCEQSLKNAMTQERRRYGFVLERQCSLAKHYLSYHSQSLATYQGNVEKWSETAKTREYLPDTVETVFSNKIRQVSVWQDDDVYSNPRSPHYDDDRMSIASQLRKTKSMDASCLDIRSIEEIGSPVTTMSRAKSEYNIHSSTNSLIPDSNSPSRRPKSMAVPVMPAPPQWETQFARALYAYLSSGENQLSFLEGDVIALMGDRNKGWQFGENLRTQCSGWFPLAYTELMDDSTVSHDPRSEVSMSASGHITPINTNSSLSPGGSGPQSGNNISLEPTIPRMFGDTLHLHRSSTNAKQIRRAIASNNIPPPALPAPVPSPSLPYQKMGITQSQSITFPPKLPSDPITFSSAYTQTTMKMSNSFNFKNSPNDSYSTHPQAARIEKPAVVSSLPVHLQNKGGKVGGPVGNISLHSSNDSGFSNDPPPQPEIDYSDDESLHTSNKVSTRNYRTRLRNQSDSNNNSMKQPSVKSSNSYSKLTEPRHYTSDDVSLILSDDRKSLVKRTRSFWKFGKSGSDNEILEGMSLWKHRDLVDVVKETEANKVSESHKKNSVVSKIRKPSRDRSQSNDSDRTINAKQFEDNSREEYKKRTERHKPIAKENQKLSLPPRKESDYDNQNVDNGQFERLDDQFYDDDDGLMLRTVNRKNILQQYNNDSTGPDSETESEVVSDDPYDCIVVDDQTTQKVKRKSHQFTNVAAIGKKLEQLSKSSKYFPDNKGSPTDNNVTDNTLMENNNERIIADRRSNSELKSNSLKRKERRPSFRTFKSEIKNNENGEKEMSLNRQYLQMRNAQNIEMNSNDRRRDYNGINNRNETAKDEHTRSSYESINSDLENFEDSHVESHIRSNSLSDNRMKSKYQDNHETSTDEFSDAVENRQFLPRTKLTKTNSNKSTSKHDHSMNLIDYGESLEKKGTNSQHNSKFDMSPHNGNMYGPWYDLWGLDASVRK